MIISIILRVLAAVCFGCLAFKVTTSIPLLALGLLLWVVSTLFGAGAFTMPARTGQVAQGPNV